MTPPVPQASLPTAQWPERLRSLISELGGPAELDRRDRIREELCVLLHSAIRRYLRLHASRMGALSRDDADDLVSEKALELFRRVESRTWRVDDYDAPQLATFLSNVARNALLRFYRLRGREPNFGDEEDGDSRNFESEVSAELASDSLDRREFIDALLRCAEALKMRDRKIWLLRVFHEMPSRLIAQHGEIRLKASHVDVLLQRCRQSVKDCMDDQGLNASDMPTGCFTELWRRMQRGEAPS